MGVPFPFNVYLLAFGAAFVVTGGSMRFWRRVSTQWDLVDDPGHRKLHSKTIPLAGGLALATGLTVTVLMGGAALFLNRSPSGLGEAFPLRWRMAGWPLVEYGLTRRALPLAAIMGGSFLMLLVGLWDDRHELRPGLKFCGQAAAALAVAASGLRITLFVHHVPFNYLVTMLWILTVTNAFNFIDNMNGLCAGLAFIAAWTFGWTAAVQGQYLVALLAALVCGSLAGFLPYNFPRATVFLGDAGSHLAGFLLAILAILPSFYTRRSLDPWAVLNPLLILAVPLVDLVQVVIYRWRIGRPFYVGDTNHLSHRLAAAGLHPSTAVLLLWLTGAAAGALSFLTLF